jgi:hypothetical protein
MSNSVLFIFSIMIVMLSVCIIDLKLEANRQEKKIKKLLDLNISILDVSQISSDLARDVYKWMKLQTGERFEAEGKTEMLEQLEKHFREAGLE